MHCGSCYVFTVSRCPDVCANISIFSLHMNTEQISMKFGEVISTANNLIDYILGEIVTDGGAGYDRIFKLMSKRCCHVTNDFTNFTVHMACCVCRAGESIAHM